MNIFYVVLDDIYSEMLFKCIYHLFMSTSLRKPWILVIYQAQPDTYIPTVLCMFVCSLCCVLCSLHFEFVLIHTHNAVSHLVIHQRERTILVGSIFQTIQSTPPKLWIMNINSSGSSPLWFFMHMIWCAYARPLS